MADGKWIAGLSPTMTAAEAARLILTARLNAVRQVLPAAVERPSEDVEHVHQLRVGTRRAGAALKLLADCVPGKVRLPARQSLRKLRRAAGQARDWDVFILGLGSARPLAAAAGKPALDFLRGYALNERSKAQRHLANAAAEISAEFDELCNQVPASIEANGSGSTAFGEIARAQMEALFASFHTAVTANPSDPAALHQLRIQAKRLRYAMELFIDCFPSSFRDVLYLAVENLQEILGNLQDAIVSIERLESLRDAVQQFMPDEWKRLRAGINGLLTGMRRKVPTAKKQFQTWRTAWFKLSAENPLT